MTAPTTALDAAHAAMTTSPDDAAARLRYFERLADGELFLLLAAEAEGDNLVPKVFDLEGGPVVLAFDLEERLAEFAAGVGVPYAALPGRVIATTLAGQGVGLGVNLGVAPSALLLEPATLDWLAAMLRHGPAEAEDHPQAFHAPAALPPGLVQGLSAKLARAGGLASHALLAGVTYRGGRRGHMLAFIDARAGAEAPLAHASAEALTFSGVDAGELDVTFLASNDPACAAMAAFALRFDLPQPAAVQVAAAPQAPGSDPARPPILR
ncbi:MAG: SseB family protein [Alphaproteobacteria bacterium]|nr:SseB family protein [Alphaproteobacteria bacterium]